MPQTSVAPLWNIKSCSLLGRREFNDDAIISGSIKFRKTTMFSAALSDGVGSVAGSGSLANELVGRTLMGHSVFLQRRLSRRPFDRTDLSLFLTALKDSFSHIVLPSYLCATLVTTIAARRSGLCVWAGDSRAYTLGYDGQLSRLTGDHVDGTGAITSFVDGAGNLVGDVGLSCFKVEEVAALALTSDGVHSCCDDEELRRFLAFIVAESFQRSFSLEVELEAFLGANLSDNASIIVWISGRQHKRLLRAVFGARTSRGA